MSGFGIDGWGSRLVLGVSIGKDDEGAENPARPGRGYGVK